MNCPNCGGETKVTNSRTTESERRTFTAGSFATVQQLVHWYTPDWVVRTRVCSSCATRHIAIELYADDFRAILTEGLPHDANA